MNFTALAARAGALLPGAAPPPFVASEPASQGGASTPLLWLAVGLVVNFAAVADAAAFWGWPSAVRFCESAVAQSAVVAVLVPLIGILLAYRAANKNTAAKVVVAQANAVAQGPQQAPASAATVATGNGGAP